jgi:CRISPR/Cas system-associated exonuclease Cas4 (RecB family)
MKSMAPPRPPSPVIDDEEDAELQLSPVEDFGIEEEDAMAPVGEIKRSPSPESKEEEEARLNVARALVKLEKLKTESEELVLSSTELLLKTIQSTNDYFLLFNPKLFSALRKYKEEARKILDEHGERSTVANAA